MQGVRAAAYCYSFVKGEADIRLRQGKAANKLYDQGVYEAVEKQHVCDEVVYTMILRVDSHLVLYRSERFFSAFPSVVTLPNNEVLLAFRRAPDHRWLLGAPAEQDLNAVDHVHFRSHIALKRFDGNLAPFGDTVSMPTHAEAADQDANLFIQSGGRLLQHGFLWYPVTHSVAEKLHEAGRHVVRAEKLGAGYVFWGSYVRHSDDQGLTWSDYQELPIDAAGTVAGGPFAAGSVALRGRMVELPDGCLLLAGYAAGETGAENQQTSFFKSDCRGESWMRLPQKLSMDGIDLQEPAIVAWPKSQISVFHRTTNNKDRLVVAQSGEDLSFSEPKTLKIIGHPYDPLVLKDGRLLLVYGCRHKPMGVRARLASSLEGLDDAEEIIIRDNSPSADTGYPTACILPDGRILVAYYIADDKGVRGIEGTILSLS